MRVKKVYALYDGLSEAFVGEFVANNEKVAIKTYESFCKKSNLEDSKDMKMISLYCIGSFESPDCIGDVDLSEEVDLSEVFKEGAKDEVKSVV